jgi:hypothetical protein
VSCWSTGLDGAAISVAGATAFSEGDEAECALGPAIVASNASCLGMTNLYLWASMDTAVYGHTWSTLYFVDNVGCGIEHELLTCFIGLYNSTAGT